MAKMPKTADDWQLYNAEDRERTARALTDALKRAAKAVRQGTQPQDALYSILIPVADGFPQTGARDTETREIAYRYLAEQRAKRAARKRTRKRTAKAASPGAAARRAKADQIRKLSRGM